AQRVSKRPHRLRVGQVDTLPPPVPVPLPLAALPVSRITVTAARFAVAAQVHTAAVVPARLATAVTGRLVVACGESFGSHVSKHYSRKKSFDKLSKDFFRSLALRVDRLGRPPHGHDRDEHSAGAR